MVSTRSGGRLSDASASGGGKRSAPATDTNQAKKAKTEEDGKLAVGDDGQVGLKVHSRDQGSTEEERGATEKKNGLEDESNVKKAKEASANQETTASNGQDEQKTASQETEKKPGEGPIEADKKDATPDAAEDGPIHGSLEAGHIYFLYRPKVEVEDVESLDDVSKFHILLIPKTGKHASGHYHRIIEVGKKKLPDPGAKRQVIWGLIGSVGSEKGNLKTAFGEYSYETKTRGTRHQAAARPAARGHYIFHSPRDGTADDPDTNRQRDYKTLLAYEITTPAPDDFGQVQKELGLEPKGAIALSIKDPEAASNNNPRAANMPREKKAHYPKHLYELFGNRRWIAPNPVSFLDYPGGELLFLSSRHDVTERLGEEGEKVEHDLDKTAEAEATDIEGALKELGLKKGDTEIEALEGHWA